MNPKIGFIGAGNMARSLIGGLRAAGFPAEAIWVSDVDPNKLEPFKRLGVQAVTGNLDIAASCNVVVLAVKPQQIREVAKEISTEITQRKPLVISIAAGIREQDLRRWLGGEVAIVRAMPNTPALVQSSATALHANPYVRPKQKEIAESLLRAVGLTVWVEQEALLEVVTAVSGSGPAYFFLLMEAMEKAGCKLGLEANMARLLVEQTALGSAKLALEADIGPEELRSRVTSPGGTTERALAVLQQGGFEDLIGRALEAAWARAVELSARLGEEE